MEAVLHITSGDFVGESLERARLPGEVLVWRDILYDGPRQPGWPGPGELDTRALFLEAFTAGGMDREEVLQTLELQYQKLQEAALSHQLVLWFDACLFDQSMLAHLLVLLDYLGRRDVQLLSIAAFPGIEPFDGLGQLNPYQLASLYDRRQAVTEQQFQFAHLVEKAFALQDSNRLAELSEFDKTKKSPLPRIPAAAKRWLAEQPTKSGGLGQLEKLTLDVLAEGCRTPAEIFSAVAERDSHPQYWGDITLWAKINGLADRNPPLVRIEGPAKRLPQWQSELDWKDFTICLSPYDKDEAGG